MSDIKTVLLDGSEFKVERLNGQNTRIINKSESAVYASKHPGIVPESDDVIEIAAHACDGLYGTNGTLYLLGTGKVELRGTDYAINFRPPSSPCNGGGDTPNSVSVFNGVKGEGLPVFIRQGVDDNDPIPYKMLDTGNVCTDYSKSYSINSSNDHYTDASVISSEKTFDLRNYNKIAVTAIAFKNSADLSARIYFKAGNAELSQPHIPYDFSGWTPVCDVSEYSANYGDPGEPVTFEIDISGINEESSINFGIYHGDDIIGYTVYFYIVKIEFLK